MYRTDVHNYYGSVDLERVRWLLKDCDCLPQAALVILEMLRQWQLSYNLHGLPIGPEASGVIGNFLLRPADISLEANGYEFLRWSDDILVFGRTIASCENSMAVLDGVLSNLRLSRSVQKTQPFDNVADAKRNLKDPRLTSLSGLLRFDKDVGIAAIREAYDSELRGNSQVPKYYFDWILGVLKNKRDPYACVSLADDPILMNVNPQMSGQYLADAVLNNRQRASRRVQSRVVDGIMNCVSKLSEDRFDGLDLHLLRATATCCLGEAEAQKFRHIATDSTRRWPVRAYGWAAYVRSTKNYAELMQAAREETLPQLRRGMIANLRGHSTRSFLKHARANFPESRYTIHWFRQHDFS